MRFGFVIPGGDVPDIIDTAVEIEQAGWDGVFVAEYLYGTDAWVSLGAMAVRTERVMLGTLLTPPSRRRPWKLASELATLDRLSRGRALLTAGLGALDTGFAAVGEATDRKVRAQLMDEGLEIMERLWSGKPFKFAGEHYKINWNNQGSYTPYEKSRVPIWAVAAWGRPKSVARALRWDGIVPAGMEADGSFRAVTPDEVKAIAAHAVENRSRPGPFDIVIEGTTPVDPQGARDKVAPYAEAGATWWIESMWEAPNFKSVMKRIKAGPPKI